MGNCCGRSLQPSIQAPETSPFRVTNNTDSSALRSMGPAQDFLAVALSPDDVVLLVLGPAGSNPTQFVQLCPGSEALTSTTAHDQSLEPPLGIQFFRAHLDASAKSCLFIVPTTFDTENIKENTVMAAVEKWLKENRPDKPWVEHILYFTEMGNIYNIKPISAAGNIRVLKKSLLDCQTSNPLNKISVVPTAVPNSIDGEECFSIPREWDYLISKGRRTKRIFRQTPASASGILQDILEEIDQESRRKGGHTE